MCLTGTRDIGRCGVFPFGFLASGRFVDDRRERLCEALLNVGKPCADTNGFATPSTVKSLEKGWTMSAVFRTLERAVREIFQSLT